MSKVVQFLEALSLTQPMSEGDYAAAVAATGLDAPMQVALLRRDPEAVNALLGGRANVLAFIFPAEDEPDSDAPSKEEPDGNPSKEPDREAHANSIAA